MAPLVRVLVVIIFPIAYPISKVQFCDLFPMGMTLQKITLIKLCVDRRYTYHIGLSNEAPLNKLAYFLLTKRRRKQKESKKK